VVQSSYFENPATLYVLIVMMKHIAIFFKSLDRGSEETHEAIQPGAVTTVFGLCCSFPALCSDQSHLLSLSPRSFILL
jgi:hypothetical protein